MDISLFEIGVESSEGKNQANIWSQRSMFARTICEYVDRYGIISGEV